MESRATTLFFILLVMVGLAGGALHFEQQAQSRRQLHRADFQQLVGGLGFGPAVDLSSCAFGFDPRLDCSCSQDSGPIPGGSCFCPRHASSILFYPPLEDRPKAEIRE